MAKDNNTSSNSGYQQQTILNLYNSGIPLDIIALQLDISQDDVDKIIKSIIKEETRKKVVAKQVSDTPSLGMFYLDAVIDIDSAINDAQTRVWKALKVEPEFNVSMEETNNVLEKFAKSKTTLVILHIDIVNSTRMSMTLPVDRLATIIQAFTQEMSLMIEAYGGYVLKYVGDAIIAFFLVSANNLYLPCINAINCAQSMIKIIQQGINPILNQYDYPEMNVRIGIDAGESAVVPLYWDIHTLDGKQILKKPHYDILGYTVGVVVKMTSLAEPSRIVIGQLVYEILDDKQKSNFEVLPVSTDVWSYVSNNTGNIYRVYSNLKA